MTQGSVFHDLLSKSSIIGNVDTNLAYIIGISILIFILTFDAILNTVHYLWGFMIVLTRAPDTSDRVLSVFITFLFLIFKAFHVLPIVFLIFPSQYNLLDPRTKSFLLILSLILFIINIILVLAPVILGFAMSHLKKWNVTRSNGSHVSKRTLKDDYMSELPLIAVIMPIYNELPEVLHEAVISTLSSVYPKELLHVFLAFDDENITTSYINCCSKLGIYTTPGNYNFAPIIHARYNGIRVSVCRFPHSGKRNSQKRAFDELEKIYNRDPERRGLLDSAILLFLDSDIYLDKYSIFNFIAAMYEEHNDALTGLITCKTSKKFNLLWFLQDVEYFNGQMYARNFQSLLGSVTCLPGALTCIKYKTFKEVSQKYFLAEGFGSRDMFDLHRCYLGEDRFLTHLIMENSKRGYTLGFCPDAHCKTEAPETWRDLLLQRRRWYLGTVPNDVFLLCSVKIWQKLPLLMFTEFFNASRHFGALLYLVYIFGPIQFDVVWAVLLFLPLFVIWIIISIDAVVTHRRKMILTYPLIFFIQPAFTWIMTIYASFTMRSIGWGGPRVEANAAINNDLSSVRGGSSVLGLGQDRPISSGTTAGQRQITSTGRSRQHSMSLRSETATESSFRESFGEALSTAKTPLSIATNEGDLRSGFQSRNHSRKASPRKRKPTNQQADDDGDSARRSSTGSIQTRSMATRQSSLRSSPLSPARVKSVYQPSAEEEIGTSEALMAVYNDYRNE